MVFYVFWDGQRSGPMAKEWAVLLQSSSFPSARQVLHRTGDEERRLDSEDLSDAESELSKDLRAFLGCEVALELSPVGLIL